MATEDQKVPPRRLSSLLTPLPVLALETRESVASGLESRLTEPSWPPSARRLTRPAPRGDRHRRQPFRPAFLPSFLLAFLPWAKKAEREREGGREGGREQLPSQEKDRDGKWERPMDGGGDCERLIFQADKDTDDCTAAAVLPSFLPPSFGFPFPITRSTHRF